MRLMSRARQSRRGGARRRHAGTRRHRRPAAAPGKAARPCHNHGLDADAAQRRNQLAGAVARRRRLYSEAGQQSRSHRLADIPPRADRKNPQFRSTRQGGFGRGSCLYMASNRPSRRGLSRVRAPSDRSRCARCRRRRRACW